MAKTVPSLSAKGWVQSGIEQIDILLGNFVVSEYSQSQTYYSKITSLPYIVATYGQSPETLREAVRTALERYFGRYFENLIITITTYDILAEDGTATARYGLRIQIEQVIDGTRYNLAADLEKIDGKFAVVAKSNNGE